MRASVLAACLVVACALGVANGAVFTGSIGSSHGKLVFLGKFVFDFDPSGTPVGTVRISGKRPTQGMQLLLFDDQPDSWPKVAGQENVNCGDAVQASHAQIELKGDPSDGTFDDKIDVVEKLRPRVWYAAALEPGGCSDTFTLDSYRLEFLNGDSQFGVDQRGMPGLYAVFFVLFLLGCGVALVVHQRAWFFPLPVRLWLAAFMLLALSTLCYLIHWATFGSDGDGVPFLEALAMLARMGGRLLMWGCLGLIGVGYGISFVALSERAARETMAAIGVALLAGVVFVGMVIWYFAARDPASSTFLWDSGFAIVLLIFQCIFAVWWAWSLLRTRSTETVPPKTQFYVQILSVYGPWFLWLPVVAIVSAATSPWYRERTALWLEVVGDFFWFTIGLYLFNPARTERVFDPLSLSSAANAADAHGPEDGFDSAKGAAGSYDDL